jgi:hypothetical protein
LLPALLLLDLLDRLHSIINPRQTLISHITVMPHLRNPVMVRQVVINLLLSQDMVRLLSLVTALPLNLVMVHLLPQWAALLETLLPPQ